MEFILPHNQEAAQRAFKAIRAAVAPLETNPRSGKPVEELPDYNDLIISFGAADYVLRYRFQGDTIFIIAAKHGKEAGFASQTDSGLMVHDPVAAAYGMLADGGLSLEEDLLEERRKELAREMTKGNTF